MNFTISHIIGVISILLILILIWTYYRLPVFRFLQGVRSMGLTKPLDIEISTWFGLTRLSFKIEPGTLTVPDDSTAEPTTTEPMRSPKCDHCQHFISISPPRFEGKLTVREGMYLYVGDGDKWIRFEKNLIYAQVDGRVERPVVSKHGRKHWWFDVVTSGELLFTIMTPDGREIEERADDLYHIYSFQVESGGDNTVITGDVVMVLAKESPEQSAS